MAMLCYLCARQRGIRSEQNKSNRKQQNQAKKVITVSVARVGDTVVVPISFIDRGQAASVNAKTIVVQVLEHLQLGTKHGLHSKPVHSMRGKVPLNRKCATGEGIKSADIYHCRLYWT